MSSLDGRMVIKSKRHLHDPGQWEQDAIRELKKKYELQARYAYDPPEGRSSVTHSNSKQMARDSSLVRAGLNAIDSNDNVRRSQPLSEALQHNTSIPVKRHAKLLDNADVGPPIQIGMQDIS
jgi:hypothetical protein